MSAASPKVCGCAQRHRDVEENERCGDCRHEGQQLNPPDADCHSDTEAGNRERHDRARPCPDRRHVDLRPRTQTAQDNKPLTLLPTCLPLERGDVVRRWPSIEIGPQGSSGVWEVIGVSQRPEGLAAHRHNLERTEDIPHRVLSNVPRRMAAPLSSSADVSSAGLGHQRRDLDGLLLPSPRLDTTRAVFHSLHRFLQPTTRVRRASVLLRNGGGPRLRI